MPVVFRSRTGAGAGGAYRRFGVGQASLSVGALYAEAQRRYLESVALYARRLFHQMGIPDVDGIDGIPPAVALQQQRGTPTTRSSVGSVTTLSNLLRMLYARAGDYPPGQPIIYAEAFSPNTPEGACPQCQGRSRIYEVTKQSMAARRYPDGNSGAAIGSSALRLPGL
jgi:excinuclease ABC subunit A